MTLLTKSVPANWLAFDLNVLRRMEFGSVAVPFTGDPALGLFLKRRGVKVLANDPLRSNAARAAAVIQNNSESLSDDDLEIILEDVYIPRHKLANPSLRNWFGETDSWWFDNVRRNLERFESPFKFAAAASLVLAVGDYVHSFTADTLEYRQPLSAAFRRLRSMFPAPVNNGQNNACQNKAANTFIAESRTDLLLLRLPPAGGSAGYVYRSRSGWREEWIRGRDDFWPDLENAVNGKLGMTVETKSQYLHLLEETLRTASHINKWAIAFVESGFISAQEVTETANRAGRRVESIYTKDFSELTGTKAVIVTA